MAEETTISIPAEASETADTATEELKPSEDLTPSEDLNTSEVAPETEEPSAEKETEKQEPKLYAGKYQSIEEFEKGYNELNKAFTQANQVKAKYDEMLRQQQQQNALKLENAQKAGFNSVEEQQIADNVKMAEFNEFWQNLASLDADAQPQVQQYLTEYYKTGNADFLKAAKMYYPAEFLERVAIGKRELQSQLQVDFENRRAEQKNQHDAQLAEIIKADYADFLSDVNENTGKAKALKAFCDADFIQSKEDMQAFKDIYTEMESFIKAAAIKEYEAQKVIEKTKKQAVINGGNSGFDLNAKRTIDDIGKMSQKEFDEYCAKNGDDWIWASVS